MKLKRLGVMKCNRKGCEFVMCNAYIDEIGYICNSCINEFKEHLKSKNIIYLTKKEYIEELKKFMNTNKSITDKIDINTFFEKYG